MISSEKKSAGPDLLRAFRTTRQRSSAVNTSVERRADSRRPRFAATARSRCLCMFSIITIAASIIAPMAMAMPPSDMMSAPDTEPFASR